MSPRVVRGLAGGLQHVIHVAPANRNRLAKGAVKRLPGHSQARPGRAGQAPVPGHQIEMVNRGLHGERGQEIAGDQHVALGGEIHVSGQRRRGMSRRCRGLGPQPGYDQIRPVGRSHPPDEPGMRGIPLGAGTERRPVGDEVNIRLAARGSREGDKRPLGVQQQVKQQVTPRPATTAGRPRQLIVTQLLHVIGDGLVGRHHGHASTAGLDMAHPATIDDPAQGSPGCNTAMAAPQGDLWNRTSGRILQTPGPAVARRV